MLRLRRRLRYRAVRPLADVASYSASEMSEVPYGLKRQPFKAAASGADVFVGPQTAKVMQSTKKALASPDAVVAVIGPAGTGKTTLVKRALGTITGDKQVIHIARMQLGHDEVLELLLEAVGATEIPASMLKQFRLFQQLCVEKANAGVRTMILVEDAVRIGEDALAELEALTAADGLDNGGANLVLMGDPTLGKLLHTDSLVRLRQRLRLYQKVQPLAAAEMQGYLKHSFRMAGGEFDLLFGEDAGTCFHALSAGIPRIVNNLVDSVLDAAAESKLSRIDVETIRRVAEEQYGLTADMPRNPENTGQAADAAPEAVRSASPVPNEAPSAGKPAIPAPADPGKARVAPETARQAPAAADTKAAPPSVSETDAERASEPRPTRSAESAVHGSPTKQQSVSGESAAAAADCPETSTGSAGDELELVQDTLPDLAVLAPDMAGSTNGKAAPDGEEIPTLFSSQTVDTGKVAPKPDDAGKEKGRPKPGPAAKISDTRTAPRSKAQTSATEFSTKPKSPADAADAQPSHRPNPEPSGQKSDAGQPRRPAQAVPASRADASPAPRPKGEPPADKSDTGPVPHPKPKRPAEKADIGKTPPPRAPAAAGKPAAAGPVSQPASRSRATAARPQANGDAAKAAKATPRPQAPAAKATAGSSGNGATKKGVATAAERPPTTGKGDDNKPDWERDPTLAELRPDFAALEQAMAEFADGDEKAPAPAPAAPHAQKVSKVELRDPTMPALPEITLDSAIEEKIAEETAARDRADGPRPGDDVPIEAAIEKPAGGTATKNPVPSKPAAQAENQPTAESTRADEELDRIAAGLARAKTIEDVDDKMAETLFGEEFSAIAAQIAANPPPEYLEAMAESAAEEEKEKQKEKTPAPGPQSSTDSKPAQGGPKTELEQQFMEVYGEDALNVDIGADEPRAGLDLSASQRLATVRALNTDGGNRAGHSSAAKSTPSPAGPPPDPIEDQITTSLTQTMRTLQATTRPANDDDDEGERKGGFFRRFRRS